MTKSIDLDRSHSIYFDENSTVLIFDIYDITKSNQNR